ncbi:hypothetical protein ACYOEI_10700 [Singulisphaera rosea]
MSRLRAVAMCLAPLVSFSAVGCDGRITEGRANTSALAKKANANGRDAVRRYMQAKDRASNASSQGKYR